MSPNLTSRIFLRVITLASLLVFTSITAFSQFNYGFRVGAHLSTIHEKKNLDWKPSYHAGIFVSYRYSNKISVLADLLYSDKGYFLQPYYGTATKFAYHLKYLNLPVLLQYNVGGRLFLLGGVEAGWLLTDYLDDYRSPSSYKKFDFGLSAGLMYQVSPRVNIMLRYTHGLADIGKPYIHQQPQYDPHIQNRSVQLSVGYALRKNAIDTSSFYVNKRDRRAIISFGLRQGLVNNEILEENGLSGSAILKKNRHGYEAGAEIRLDLFKYMYASFGVSYLQKGNMNDNAYKVNYITPLLLTGISPIRNNFLTLSVEAGAAINFLVSRQYTNLPPSANISEYKTLIATFYGGEVATDVIKPVNLFFNYRRMTDAGNFIAFNDVPGKLTLTNRSHIFSVGIRLRATRKEKVAIKKESHIENFYFGVKGGVNLNQTTYTNLPNGYNIKSERLLRAHAGIYFQIRLYRNFSFIPELQFLEKTVLISNSLGDTHREYLYSVEQPFMFAYAASRNISIEAGAVVGFLLEDSGPLGTLGTNVGARYKISERISFACRYYRGFTTLGHIYKSGYPLDAQEYDNNIQFSTYLKLANR